MHTQRYSVSGWLFDSYYSSHDKSMIFWIKKEQTDDKCSYMQIKDTRWKNYFYVASSDNKKINLQKILNNEEIMSFIDSYDYVLRQEKITDSRKKRKVLRLYLLSPPSLPFGSIKLAKMIERLVNFQEIRLYNVDLLPDQQYFFDNDIFPLGLYEINNSNNVHNENKRSDIVWKPKNDNTWSLDYKLPVFNSIHLSLNFTKEGIIQNRDELRSVSIKYFDIDCNDNKRKNQKKIKKQEEITGSSEKNLLKDIMKIIRKADPDFIFTDDGDSFMFPYLVYRAKENNVDLYFGRDYSVPLKISSVKGTSYFSYGHIYYRPSPVHLHGRVHIDLNNISLVVNDSNLHGLFEISRLCRMPLHTSSRATIGRCLTSLHMYTATKRGLLIPWKPILSEYPKTLRELLIADRGGLILEPKIGVHENVAEFDFVSLYPSIMVQKNISAETINCDCCFNTSKLKVPELGYHICKKRGVVSESLEIVLQKRKIYKDLRNDNAIDSGLKEIYDKRQSALKWILVTSFGYLGFNNAKFGRIDAHIAVCAFARDILLQTKHIAEDSGFNVLHGIVDSIWIKKEKNSHPSLGIENGEMTCEKDINRRHVRYTQLRDIIKERTGFDISFEGIYKWIVFLPSKIHKNTAAVNRYFGVFEDGTVKIRGIDSRRHDTPPFLSRCQKDVLDIMKKGNSIKEVRQLFPLIKEKVDENISMIKERKVPIKDLVFTKRLSKDCNQYQDRNTLENSAIKQLEINGYCLKKGQIVQYVIKNNNGPFLKRTVPMQLIKQRKDQYDAERYCELLLETINTLLKPFGIEMVVKDESYRNKVRLQNKITDFCDQVYKDKI